MAPPLTMADLRNKLEFDPEPDPGMEIGEPISPLKTANNTAKPSPETPIASPEHTTKYTEEKQADKDIAMDDTVIEHTTKENIAGEDITIKELTIKDITPKVPIPKSTRRTSPLPANTPTKPRAMHTSHISRILVRAPMINGADTVAAPSPSVAEKRRITLASRAMRPGSLGPKKNEVAQMKENDKDDLFYNHESRAKPITKEVDSRLRAARGMPVDRDLDYDGKRRNSFTRVAEISEKDRHYRPAPRGQLEERRNTRPRSVGGFRRGERQDLEMRAGKQEQEKKEKPHKPHKLKERKVKDTIMTASERAEFVKENQSTRFKDTELRKEMDRPIQNTTNEPKESESPDVEMTDHQPTKTTPPDIEMEDAEPAPKPQLQPQVTMIMQPFIVSTIHAAMREGDSLTCFNCRKHDHWWMDCEVGCAHCGKDGHRTMDCKHRAP